MDINKIELRLKELLQKEAIVLRLSEESFKTALTLFKTVLDKLLTEDLEEVSPQEIIENDLDTLIEKELKENKVTGNKTPIYFFIERNFCEVLGLPRDYYLLRKELLEHSRKLKADPDSPDYLIWEGEESNGNL